MEESSRIFDNIDAYLEDEKKQLDELYRIPVTPIDQKLKLERKLDRKIPSRYDKLNAEDTIKRVEDLVLKISRNTATNDEWEEYGWRIAGK